MPGVFRVRAAFAARFDRLRLLLLPLRVFGVDEELLVAVERVA